MKVDTDTTHRGRLAMNPEDQVEDGEPVDNVVEPFHGEMKGIAALRSI